MGKINRYLLILAFAPLLAVSQSTEVVAPPINGGTGLNPGNPGGPCALCKMRLVVHPKCYGTNLRSVSNPVSPSGTVTMKLKFNGREEIRLQFPGRVTSKKPSPELTANEVKMFFGNDEVRPKPTMSAGLIDGELNNFPVRSIDGKKLSLEYLQMEQDVETAYGQYYAKDGPITNVSHKVDIKENNTVIVDVSMPGQEGYCGGYHSPLMVFFDEQRPKFEGISDFPINGRGMRRNWPEKGSPGYFLVAKKAGVAKVSSRTDIRLFEGGDDQYKNGFEMLAAEFDSNKDGLISAKDARFKELFLWRDANGAGDPKESDLQSLSKAGLLSIDLSYKLEKVIDIGNRAQERERSKFKFKDSKGKESTGTIIDMWFAAID